jgi:hypothetical protein
VRKKMPPKVRKMGAEPVLLRHEAADAVEAAEQA